MIKTEIQTELNMGRQLQDEGNRTKDVDCSHKLQYS